jgi:hypothetical protein
MSQRSDRKDMRNEYWYLEQAIYPDMERIAELREIVAEQLVRTIAGDGSAQWEIARWGFVGAHEMTPQQLIQYVRGMGPDKVNELLESGIIVLEH